jgi:hypothetical protein
MIEFISENLEDLSQEVSQKQFEISVEILRAVCTGVEDELTIVQLPIASKIPIETSVSKESFLDVLLLNISRVSEVEEYELCARAVKCIHKLEKYNPLKVNKMTSEITAEDVVDVANRINITITNEQVIRVLEMYDDEASNDSTATWDLIVENCIHSLN